MRTVQNNHWLEGWLPEELNELMSKLNRPQLRLLKTIINYPDEPLHKWAERAFLSTRSARPLLSKLEKDELIIRIGLDDRWASLVKLPSFLLMDQYGGSPEDRIRNLKEAVRGTLLSLAKFPSVRIDVIAKKLSLSSMTLRNHAEELVDQGLIKGNVHKGYVLIEEAAQILHEMEPEGKDNA